MYKNKKTTRRRFDAPRKVTKKMAHSTMDINLLINKVNDEAVIKTAEHEIKHKFSDFQIDARLLNNISQKGFENPTPIQDQSIPPALEGRDVIGIANTGTGKTAAFLIPIINKMLANPNEKALILAPTRELAFQIDEEFREFAKGLGLNSALCIGGTNLHLQRKMFNRPVNFVIGTPGRVIDLLNQKVFSLTQVKNIVLDEADRMVDMGFIKDIKLVLSHLPKVRQSFFFTATGTKGGGVDSSVYD